MGDKSQFTVKAKRRIEKYAEGAVPGKDKPMEVVEAEDIFVGEEAIKVLKAHGVSEEQARKIAANQNKQKSGGKK